MKKTPRQKTSGKNPAATRGRRRVRGKRGIQVLKMTDALYWSIALWARQRSRPEQPTPIRQIYDEAVDWFLQGPARHGYTDYLAAPMREAAKRSLWLDKQLLQAAGACAKRDGVPRNRVLYTAFVLHLKAFGPVAKKADVTWLRKIKSKGGQRGRPLRRKTAGSTGRRKPNTAISG